MKLERGKNLEKNLKLLRSCSQVEIIELTEAIDYWTKKQSRVVSKNPELRKMLTSIYEQEMEAQGIVDLEEPQPYDLVGLEIPGYDVANDIQPIREYMSLNQNVSDAHAILEDYKTLHALLSAERISLRNIKKFMNSPETTDDFKDFVTTVKEHSPLFLSVQFKHKSIELAERNDIATPTFYANANRAFTADSTTISLGHDIRGRLVNAGRTLVASAALVAVLASGAVLLAADKDEVIQGKTDPHSSYTENITSPAHPGPVVAVSPKETSTPVENNGPISINENISSYEDACNDFFQKTAEVYKYNTGEDINLSGYGQSDIAINRNATVYKIEKDGVVYTISSQGHAAPNPRYLREAFEALGVEFTTETTRTTCIIDKNDSSKSIAIVDSSGNPVRSGNVLTDTGSGGYMYNPDMVRGGRQVLEAEGRDGSTLTEAECVAAFLLSDLHNTQNPELSIALGETAKLADTIKTTFYGSKDAYAIYLYSQDATRFANNFNEKVTGISPTEQVTDDLEHGER